MKEIMELRDACGRLKPAKRRPFTSVTIKGTVSPHSLEVEKGSSTRGAKQHSSVHSQSFLS